MRRQDLQADRQTMAITPGRKTHGWKPGQIGSDGQDVALVHRQGVGGPFPQAKGRDRGSRLQYHVYFLKKFPVLFVQQCPRLLRRFVVRVVVARRKHKRAEQNAPLDFLPKTPGSGAHVEFFQSAGVRNAVAVTNPIVATQVAGGFGGRQNIIDRNQVFFVGAFEVDYLRPAILQPLSGTTGGRKYIVVIARSAGRRCHVAHAQPPQVIFGKRLHLFCNRMRHAIRV